MSGLPLFDVLISSSADATEDSVSRGLGERMGQLADQLIESCLNDCQELDRLDRLLAPREPEHWDMRVAALIRGMYEQWAQEVESVLERITLVKRLGGSVGRVQELCDQHGRVRAMLSISLQDIAEGQKQIKEGRCRSLQEVRRELRLDPKQ